MKQKKDLGFLMPALSWGATPIHQPALAVTSRELFTGASLTGPERILALERDSWRVDWKKGSRRRLGNLNLR